MDQPCSRAPLDFLLQRRSGFNLAETTQVDGEVAGRSQGVGVIVSEDPPTAGQGVLVQVPAAWTSPSWYRSTARLLAEVRVSG